MQLKYILMMMTASFLLTQQRFAFLFINCLHFLDLSRYKNTHNTFLHGFSILNYFFRKYEIDEIF